MSLKLYVDNIVFQLQKAGGISVYWAEHARRLMRSGADATFIEQHGPCGNIFREELALDKGRILYEKRLPLRLLRYLPLQAKIRGMSLFHSSYYRVCRQRDVVNVVTVYDFIYERFNSGLKKLVHAVQKRYALEHADGIICISENTRADLLHFYPWAGEKEVRVIHTGAGDDYFPLEQGGGGCIPGGPVPGKYILYVGARDGYKNFAAAVAVLGLLPDYDLVMVGGGALSATETRDLEAGLAGRYRHLGSPDNRELNLLYNNAVCLFYPSSYEGFGIPLVEAMRAGCPVVATGASSIPEVVGSAGVLVDPRDAQGTADRIRGLEDASLRRAIIAAGFDQARKFSWDRCFDETMGFYEQLLSRRNPNL